LRGLPRSSMTSPQTSAYASAGRWHDTSTSYENPQIKEASTTGYTKKAYCKNSSSISYNGRCNATRYIPDNCA
jgi:hypothetical protein